jgi:alpha-galactosidase
MPGFGLGGKQDLQKGKQFFAEWRQIAPLMLGDYYPLTPYSLKLDQWIAWQFNRPEQGDGVVQTFRRDQCETGTQTYRLRDLDPSATYELTNFDVPGTSVASGKELMEKGLPVEIKDKPAAAVIVYRRVKP